MSQHYKLPLPEIFASAWAKAKGSKETLVTVLVLTFVLVFGLQLLARFAQFKHASTVAKILQVLAIIIQMFLSWGMVYIGIRRSANVPVRFGMVKDVIRLDLFLKILGLYFLIFLIVIPALLLPVGVEIILRQHGSQQAIIFAVILHVLFNVVIAYLITRIFLAKAIVIMEGLMPWAAIKKSFIATRWNALLLFGFLVFVFLVLTVSVIPLLIGFIWSIPFALIAYGEIYQRLVVQRTRM